MGTFGFTAEQIDKDHIYAIDQLLDTNGQMDRSFTEYLRDRLPSDFGAENTSSLASFLSSMLQREPQRRSLANDLLNHPFLVRVS